jgi:hypothetical protein
MAAGTGITNLGIQEVQIRARIRGGADWFIWIAALSIINAIILTTGGKFHFIFGLGCTDVVAALAAKLPGGAVVAAWVVNIVVAGVFALFGWFGRQAKPWAFYVGMAFYVLDAVLMLVFADWLGLAFHAYALFRMYGGVKAVGELENLKPAALAAGVGSIG